MEEVLFCSQCGIKLNPNAKFCYACGAKTDMQEVASNHAESVKTDSVSQKLYNQYHDIICDKIIAAYCNQITPALNVLYQNGVSYGFTNEMVDKVIAEQEKQIDRFVKHLENLYIDGSLLMLDCTWAKENECVEFGANLGFCEEDSQAIYTCFIEKNRLKDKNIIILEQLDVYEHKGEIASFDTILANKDIGDEKFYLRFIKAVEEFARFQETLHKKSKSIELSDSDIDALYQKAEEIGFYDIAKHPDYDEAEGFEVINKLISGTEIKLGYTIQVNEKMLSSAIPFRKVRLLGENICFESSYFLDEYVAKIFVQTVDQKIEKMLNVLKMCERDMDDPHLSEYLSKIGGTLHSAWRVGLSSVCDQLPIGGENRTELKTKVRSLLDPVLDNTRERFQEFSDAIDRVDEVVDATILLKELKSSSRGTWSGGGFGLKGAVVGAVTASALNAGSDLIYSLIDGISLMNTNNMANESKLEIFKMALSELDESILCIKAFTLVTIRRTLSGMLPLNYSNENEDKTKTIYHYYRQEKDELKKRKLALQLLRLEPHEKEQYTPLLECILAEPEDKIQEDVAALHEIASFFRVELEQTVADFEKKEKDKIKKSYSKQDVKRCEALLKLEKVIGNQTDIHDVVLYDFFTSCEELQQKVYTSDELHRIVKLLTEYGKCFSYPTEKIVVSDAKHYFDYHLKNNADKSPAEVKSLLNDVETLHDICPKAKEELQSICNKTTENYISSYDNVKLKNYTFDELNSVTEILKELGKELAYQTDSIIEDRVTVYAEYRIKNDLKEYTPEELNILLENLDLACKKYPTIKPLIDNAKEQAVYAIFAYHKISSKASSQQDLEHNIERLEYFNQNCSWDFSEILQKEISKLEQLKIQDDIQARTAYGETYDSAEEANAVKDEIEILEKISKENENMSQAIQLFKIMQYDFKTKRAIEEIAQKEKKLIKHIEILCTQTSRKTSFWKLLITLIVTPIVWRIALIFSIIGIAIGLCAIIGIWGWYIDEYKDCKEHNSQINQCKAEIKEFEKLFIVKDGHLIKRK